MQNSIYKHKKEKLKNVLEEVQMKKEIKKLVLSRETIRNLNDWELRHVAGGPTAAVGTVCTCPPGGSVTCILNTTCVCSTTVGCPTQQNC
jgi:natural product precursor